MDRLSGLLVERGVALELFDFYLRRCFELVDVGRAAYGLDVMVRDGDGGGLR